jgi:hypothetical protein
MKIRRSLDDIIKIMTNTMEEDNAQRDSNHPFSQINIILCQANNKEKKND